MFRLTVNKLIEFKIKTKQDPFCIICQEPMKVDDKVIFSTCKTCVQNMYHYGDTSCEGLMKWLQYSSMCPHCGVQNIREVTTRNPLYQALIHTPPPGLTIETRNVENVEISARIRPYSRIPSDNTSHGSSHMRSFVPPGNVRHRIVHPTAYITTEPPPGL